MPGASDLALTGPNPRPQFESKLTEDFFSKFVAEPITLGYLSSPQNPQELTRSYKPELEGPYRGEPDEGELEQQCSDQGELRQQCIDEGELEQPFHVRDDVDLESAEWREGLQPYVPLARLSIDQGIFFKIFKNYLTNERHKNTYFLRTWSQILAAKLTTFAGIPKSLCFLKHFWAIPWKL